MMNNQPDRIVARDRDESDSCECLTPGCCIDHTAEAADINLDIDRLGCETW